MKKLCFYISTFLVLVTLHTYGMDHQSESVVATVKTIDTGKIVSTIAVIPNSTLIIAGSYEGPITIWDTVTGECKRTLIGHDRSVTSIKVTSDGTQIVSGSYDATIKIWNLFSGQCKTLTGHESWVNAVALTHDDTRIISGSSDHTIKIWNTLSGDCIKTLIGHSNEVKAVTVTPDGKHIVSGSQASDESIKIWDIDGNCEHIINNEKNNDINSLIVTSDNNLIISESFSRLNQNMESNITEVDKFFQRRLCSTFDSYNTQ